MGKPTPPPWIVNTTAVVVVLAAGVTAVWMTRDPEPITPSVLEHPRVVWEPGPPQGPFEDDPWVKALRQYYLEWAIADNARDFTDTRLAHVAEPSEIAVIAQITQGDLTDPQGKTVWLGPLPMIITGVEVAADGRSAVVTTCAAGGWEANYTSPEATIPETSSLSAYRVVLGEDGHRRVASGAPHPSEECSLEGVSVGRFDPAPVPQPPGTYTEDDIRMPDFGDTR